MNCVFRHLSTYLPTNRPSRQAPIPWQQTISEEEAAAAASAKNARGRKGRRKEGRKGLHLANLTLSVSLTCALNHSQSRELTAARMRERER
jgi:hypothetical protein